MYYASRVGGIFFVSCHGPDTTDSYKLKNNNPVTSLFGR